MALVKGLLCENGPTALPLAREYKASLTAPLDLAKKQLDDFISDGIINDDLQKRMLVRVVYLSAQNTLMDKLIVELTAKK